MNSQKSNYKNSLILHLFLVLLATLGLTGTGLAQKKSSSAPPPPPPKAQPQKQQAPQQRQTGGQGTGQGVNNRVGRGVGGVTTVGGGRGVPGGGVGVVKPAGAGSGGSRTPYVRRPGEEATDRPGGGKIYRNPATHQTVVTDAKGKIQRIEATRGLAGTNKMVINHGPGGGRVVETGAPGARVVSYGPHQGFVEHPLRSGYISRTYVRGGNSYAHVYREYRYNKFAYYRYVPGAYYSRRFYAWAVTPWGAPVPYAWFGIANPSPWFGFYPGYFTPYADYASPDLWLTDYLLAQNLRLAYENEQAGDAGQNPPPAPTGEPAAAALSPDVKAEIANEVRQQLKAESADAAAPASSRPQAAPGEKPPAALDPSQSHFVVSSSLDVATADGQDCQLTPGDVIFRIDDTPDNNNKVLVKVVSSKKNDCSVGAKPMLAVNDLQEMHNSFQEQLDAGLKMLAENQAKGLPNGPDAAPRQLAEGTADPSPEAESQLAAQESEAANLEGQVRGGGNNN